MTSQAGRLVLSEPVSSRVSLRSPQWWFWCGLPWLVTWLLASQLGLDSCGWFHVQSLVVGRLAVWARASPGAASLCSCGLSSSSRLTPASLHNGDEFSEAKAQACCGSVLQASVSNTFAYVPQAKPNAMEKPSQRGQGFHMGTGGVSIQGHYM